MTTIWNTSEQSSGNTKKNKKDNFFDPPYFDVLENINTEGIDEPFSEGIGTEDIGTEGTGEPLIEGFSDFPIFQNSKSYFAKCKRFLKWAQAGAIGKGIKDFIDTIFCPITKADQIVQRGLENMLSIFIALENCKDKKDKDYVLTDVVDPKILWIDTDDPLESFVSNNGDIIEGFDLGDVPLSVNTVDSFRKNHSWINSDILEAQMGTYYFKVLNDAETAKQGYMDETELFEFNNKFDDSLNKPSIITIIKRTKITDDWLDNMNLRPRPATTSTTKKPLTLTQLLQLLIKLYLYNKSITNFSKQSNDLITSKTRLLNQKPVPTASILGTAVIDVTKNTANITQYINQLLASVAVLSDIPSINTYIIRGKTAYNNLVAVDKNTISVGNRLKTASNTTIDALKQDAIISMKSEKDAVYTARIASDFIVLSVGLYVLEVERKLKGQGKLPMVTPSLNCSRPRNCAEKNQCILNELRKNAKDIKNQIYNILMIPIMMYIFYNVYFMFFFRTPDGDGSQYENMSGGKANDCYNNGDAVKIKKLSCEVPWFADWDGIFTKGTGGRLNFFFEFIFKPVKYIYTFLNWIKSFHILKTTNETFPYVVFVIFFILFYNWWKGMGTKLFGFLKKLLSLENLNQKDTLVLMLTSFATIVVIFSFIQAFFRDSISWAQYIKFKPISGSLVAIIYWILRAVLNFILIPFTVLICVIYILLYLFFGIFINNTEVFKIIGHINQFIYTRLYTPFESTKYVSNLIRNVFWWFFIFLVEIYVLYILVNGITKYATSIKSPDLRTFLIIIYVCVIFVIFLWAALKLNSNVKEQLFMYSPDAKIKASGLDRPSAKDFRVIIDDKDCFDYNTKQKADWGSMNGNIMVNADNLIYNEVNDKFLKKVPGYELSSKLSKSVSDNMKSIGEKYLKTATKPFTDATADISNKLTSASAVLKGKGAVLGAAIAGTFKSKDGSVDKGPTSDGKEPISNEGPPDQMATDSIIADGATGPSATDPNIADKTTDPSVTTNQPI